MPAAIARFFTGYYTHPFYAPSNSDGNTTSEKTYPMLQIKPAPPAEVKRPASSDGPGGPELLATIDDEPCMRSEKAYLSASPSVLRVLLSSSILLEHSEEDSKGHVGFLNVNVRILHGTETLWGIVWGIWELERELGRWDAEGRKRRDVTFTRMDGGNHYVC